MLLYGNVSKSGCNARAGDERHRTVRLGDPDEGHLAAWVGGSAGAYRPAVLRTGQQRPKTVAAGFDRHGTDLPLPIAFVAVGVAPGP